MITRSGQAPVIGRRTIKDIPDSTSDFVSKDLAFLNITYADTDVDEIFPVKPGERDIQDYQYFYLKHMEYDKLVHLSEHEIGRKEVTLLRYLETVVNITEETVTNDLVSFIMSELQLNQYPFVLRHERKYVAHVPGRDITSIPDISIEDARAVLVVDENKSLYNHGMASHWGEYQIAGEVFTVLYRNYSKDTVNYGESFPVYAIRAIGPFFTFYKTVASKEYLECVTERDMREDQDGTGIRFRLSERLVIQRFPPNDPKELNIPGTEERAFVGLNYLDVEERKLIVELLLSLKLSLMSSHSRK